MSNLSELLPSGGGQNAVDFVASGTLPNGKPVILKANGQVEVVGIGSTSVPQNIPTGGKTAVNGTSASQFPEVSFDPNTEGKCAVLFRDDSAGDYGKVAIGTISGTTVTFGTPVTYRDTSFNNAGQAIAYNPNVANQLLVFYNVASPNNCYSKVGTVSGTSISFGSAVQFKSGPADYLNVSFDPKTTGKFVLVYQDNSNNSYGTSIVGTLSGTTASYGSAVVFNSDYTLHSNISYDDNTAGKCLVASADTNSNKTGTGRLGTVSGTSISFGASAAFNSGGGGVTDMSVSSDPNTADKYVIAYRDQGNSNYGKAVAVSVSGTTLSFGTEVTFNAAGTEYIAVDFDKNTTGKFVIVYQDGGNSNYGTAIVGNLSGTSISFGTEQVFESLNSQAIKLGFNPSSAGQFLTVFKYDGKAYAILGQIASAVQATNLTSTNLIGIAAGAASSGATAKINTWGGINESQTSLTIGTDYYAQTNGTITTATGGQKLGTAISATTINMRDLP